MKQIGARLLVQNRNGPIRLTTGVLFIGLFDKVDSDWSEGYPKIFSLPVTVIKSPGSCFFTSTRVLFKPKKSLEIFQFSSFGKVHFDLFKVLKAKAN